VYVCVCVYVCVRVCVCVCVCVSVCVRASLIWGWFKFTTYYHVICMLLVCSQSTDTHTKFHAHAGLEIARDRARAWTRSGGLETLVAGALWQDNLVLLVLHLL